MPNYIRGTEAAATTNQDTDDLMDRRQQRDNLLQTRKETNAAFKKAQNDLTTFRNQVAAYRTANNIKNPSSIQLAAIDVVTKSVSNINLTGPSHGISDIDRRIAAHACALKKKVDETSKAWNQAGKVWI